METNTNLLPGQKIGRASTQPPAILNDRWMLCSDGVYRAEISELTVGDRQPPTDPWGNKLPSATPVTDVDNDIMEWTLVLQRPDGSKVRAAILND